MAQESIAKRSEDYARWYTDVITKAELADYSPVKGCMVIRPYGFAIWERMKEALDRRIKETGHENAYFPLFIPKSFLAREAAHVEGFAKECAIVTHSRLKVEDGALVVDPESALEEELVIRPTSETIMYAMFAKWIQSYRDLPLLINQWANVVRWEMRTRLFLRTAEFLWQEGHTAHETAEESEAEVRTALSIYREFMEGHMAMPVLTGRKSDAERFAGALHTYSCEALMQNGWALQAGTSHNLGQNFAKAFNVQFQGRDAKIEHVWQTSWGVSTRLVGGLVMTHSDDNGLVLPPKLAPIEAVVVPIYKTDAEKERIHAEARAIEGELAAASIRARSDLRENYKPGWKYFHWEGKGVPVRLEIGPKDIEKGTVLSVRRDTGEKRPLPRAGVAPAVREMLDAIQAALFEKARKFRDEMTADVSDYGEFSKIVEERGGFLRSPWCGRAACEEKVKAETKATVRSLPIDPAPPPEKPCVACGEKAAHSAVFARAY